MTGEAESGAWFTLRRLEPGPELEGAGVIFLRGFEHVAPGTGSDLELQIDVATEFLRIMLERATAAVDHAAVWRLQSDAATARSQRKIDRDCFGWFDIDPGIDGIERARELTRGAINNDFGDDFVCSDWRS